jgi:hypothetical protein
MIADADPRPAGLEPAASLTSVRVKRRKGSLQPSGKRGDLTAENAPPPAAVAELPSGTVIVLPPPVIDRHAQQESLPFAEVMLPELADDSPDETPEPEIFMPEPTALPAEAESLDLLLWSGSEAEPAAPAFEPEPTLPDSEVVEPELVEPVLPETASIEPAAAKSEPDAEAEPIALEPDIVEIEPRLIELGAPVLMPEPVPEPMPAPSVPQRDEASLAATPPVPLETAATHADILDYWDSLRGGRDFPPLDELDRAHVAATWSNTVLLAIESQELPRITRLGENDGEIEYTANVIDWIMSRGRNSAKRGEPMEEERRFPVSEGSARYRLLLLPFSSYGLSCDHVLCHLSRAPEISAVASFKRWLAS